MQRILRFTLISALIFGLSGKIEAQDSRPKPKTVEIVKKPHSISLGVDLSPFIVTAFDSSRKGFQVIGRYGVQEKFFVTAEAGYEKVNFDNEYIQYASDGSFLKLGLDYDVFDVDEPGNNDNILFGIRYGFGLQQQQSDRFIIQNGYWGDATGSSGLSTVNSHWMELLFGLRTEVLKNLYMGWTIRGKIFLTGTNPTSLVPYSIPGYGNGDKKFVPGFSYTLEYKIPFNKKKSSIVSGIGK
jgi:hypothetical protein